MYLHVLLHSFSFLSQSKRKRSQGPIRKLAGWTEFVFVLNGHPRVIVIFTRTNAGLHSEWHVELVTTLGHLVQPNLPCSKMKEISQSDNVSLVVDCLSRMVDTVPGEPLPTCYCSHHSPSEPSSWTWSQSLPCLILVLSFSYEQPLVHKDASKFWQMVPRVKLRKTPRKTGHETSIVVILAICIVGFASIGFIDKSNPTAIGKKLEKLS